MCQGCVWNSFSHSCSFALRGDSLHSCSLGWLQRIYLLLQFHQQAHPCAVPLCPLPPPAPLAGVFVLLSPQRALLCPLCSPSQHERSPARPSLCPSKGVQWDHQWGESSIPTHPTHPPTFARLVSTPTTSLSTHSNSPLLSKNVPILSSILSLAADSSCCYNNEQQPSQIGQTLPHFPACIQITSLGVNTLSSSSSLCHLPARGRLLPLGGCWPSAPPMCLPSPLCILCSPPAGSTHMTWTTLTVPPTLLR